MPSPADYENVLNQAGAEAPTAPTASAPPIDQSAQPTEQDYERLLNQTPPEQPNTAVTQDPGTDYGPGIGGYGPKLLRPVLAATSYLRGQHGPLSAQGAGIVQSTLGNVPDKLWEAGVGKFHDLTGAGRSQEEQAQYDQAYEQDLKSRYPAESIGGQLAGMIGLGVGAGAFAPAWATASTLGRIGWQGVIGAGTGGWLGAVNGEGWRDRVNKATTDAIFGGIGGIALGSLAEGVGSVVGKMFGKPMDSATHKAIRDASLNPYAPIGEQTEQISKQFGEHFVHITALKGEAPSLPNVPETTVEQIGGLNQRIQAAVTERVEAQKATARQFLQSANSKGAAMSADGLASMSQEVMANLQKQGFRIESIAPDSGAMDGLAQIKQMQQLAEQSSNKQLTLQALEDTHQAINRIRPQGGWTNADGTLTRDGAMLSAIQHAFDDYMDTAVNSHLFSGDPSAYQDLLAWRQGWSQYKDMIDPSKVIGRIYKQGRTGDEVAEWFQKATTLGAGERAHTLAEQLKNTLGEDSAEFQALREASFQKFFGGEQSPTQILRGLHNYLNSPVSRSLSNPQEIKALETLETGLSQLPHDAPPWAHLVNFGLGSALGGGQEMLEAVREGGDWRKALEHAIIGGIVMERLPTLVPSVGRRLGQAIGAAARIGPAVGVQGLLNVPTVQQAMPQSLPLAQSVPVPRKDGGVVSSAQRRRQRAVAVASRH